MLSRSEVTEGLLIAVLGAHLVLLFFIAWQFTRFGRTLGLYFRRARRLAIAITGTVGKMDCDELIDLLLSAETACAGDAVCHRVAAPAGGTAGTAAGGTAATPDVLSPAAEQREEPDTQPPEWQQKHRERLAALVAWGGGGGGRVRYGLAVHGKQLTADHIDAMEDSEIENVRPLRRLGAAMTKTLGSAAIQLYAGVASMFLPIPAENKPGLVADLEGDSFVGHALSTATCELYYRYSWCMAPLTAALTILQHCQFGHRCPVSISDGGHQGEPRDIESPDRVSWGAITDGSRKSHGEG